MVVFSKMVIDNDSLEFWNRISLEQGEDVHVCKSSCTQLQSECHF